MSKVIVTQIYFFQSTVFLEVEFKTFARL